MTDPNLPPERVVIVDPPQQTTVNVERERSGGGGGIVAFLVGGLLVVVAIIAFVIYNGGVEKEASDTNVDVDVNLPSLPDAPKLPQIEPPTLPSPAPSN